LEKTTMSLQIHGLEKCAKIYYGLDGEVDAPTVELKGVSEIAFSAEHRTDEYTIVRNRRRVSVPSGRDGWLTFITTFQSQDERQVFSDAWLNAHKGNKLRISLVSNATGKEVTGMFPIFGLSRLDDEVKPVRWRVIARFVVNGHDDTVPMQSVIRQHKTLLPLEQRIIEVGYNDAGFLVLLCKYFEGEAEFDGCIPFTYFCSPHCKPSIRILDDLERDMVNLFGREYTVSDELEPFARLAILQRIVADEIQAALTG
jgi:hypothetical protein